MRIQDNDALGDRGETLVEYLLTDFGDKTKPLFRVKFLGETMSEPLYVTQRAENVALVMLTRDPEVFVRSRGSPESALDFVLGLDRNPGRASWLLEVEVSGERKRPQHPYRPRLTGRQWEAVAAASFPTCLFVVDVISSMAFFSWLRVPQAKDGRLLPAVKDEPRKLTKLIDHRLKTLLDEAREFYRNKRNARALV